MTELFNPFMGTTCWVADDRVDEYKAAGFVPVANLEKPKAVEKKTKTEEVKAEAPEPVEVPTKIIKKATRKK